MKSDFETDLRDQLHQALIKEGYDVPQGGTDAVVRWWFTTRARRIPRQRRLVKWSKELVSKKLPDEERQAVKRIERFSLEGKNLNHFLSRKRLQANFNDALFVSWKILHFHLGPPSGGEVPGTSRLLYARVEPDALYLVDVLDHAAFSDQGLVGIVHANWPNLHGGVRLKGVTGLATQTSNEDIAKLRAAGVTVLTELAGAVYAPMGGGLATDRSSVYATLDSDRLKKQLRQLEDRFRMDPVSIAQAVGVSRDSLPTPVRLKLHVTGDTVRIQELSTQRTVTEFEIFRRA